MEAAMVKLYSSEVAGEVTDMAVRIHGGYGLMEEYDVERFWRDHRQLRTGEGTRGSSSSSSLARSGAPTEICPLSF
jgi:alkylation response protein AidB-like acyl-CoA dehydrogenase